MKNLVLSVALCFVFVAISYADRCSDLCNQCKKTGLSGICCSAYMACREKCKDASEQDCQKSDGNNEDDNRHRQHVFAPAFERERQVRQEVQEGVDRAIRNWQHIFQNPHQPNFGFGI